MNTSITQKHLAQPRHPSSSIRGRIDCIRTAWSSQTAAPGTLIDAHPARGQCAVTALLIQELLGGEIVRAEVEIHDLVTLRFKMESHYWNRVVGMGDIDLTREQYTTMLDAYNEKPPEIPIGEVVPRSRLLEGERAIAARTPERYAMLKYGYELALRLM